MELFSIGQISKISNIPIRTLRYYDEEGIIVPFKRDENTGYRYYSYNQMIQLQILKEFKALGLSLDEIKSIIHRKNPKDEAQIDYLKTKLNIRLSDIKKEITELRFKEEAIHKAYSRLNDGLEVLSNSNEVINTNKIYSNEIYTIPEVWTLSIRKNNELNANELFLEHCLEVYKLLDKYHLFQSGGFIAIFHDGFQSQFAKSYGDLEICVPFVRPKNFECDEMKLFGGILVASTIHIGHYKHSHTTYQELIKWIEEEKYSIIGNPIELYILDPYHFVNSESYITRICFPVKNINT